MSNKVSTILLGTIAFLWIVFSGLFWSKALFYDSAGNLVAGHVNIWGDWAAHMTMGNAMAERGFFLPVSPLLITQPFAYPFVSNMISSILLRMGLPYIFSYTLPSFLLMSIIPMILFWFYRLLFKSKKAALIATLIFMLNGGVGFYYFFQDITNATNPISTFLNPPHEYTRLDKEGMKWINVVDSMIIPQRAFTLGFPLALIALGLIYQSIQFDSLKKPKITRIAFASLIIGSLPLIHTHSFLALFMIISFWSLTDLLIAAQSYGVRSKQVLEKIYSWGLLAVASASISIPVIKIFLSQNINQSFLSWYPGWLSTEYKLPWIVFWFKNWSITPFFAIIAWMAFAQLNAKKHIFGVLLFMPFFALFIASNLFLFQPFAWDNTKILMWSAVGFAGLSGWLLATIWEKSNTIVTMAILRKLIRSSVLVLFLLMTLSGIIDLHYIARHDLHSHVMFSKEEVDLAAWAKAETAPTSIWLTGEQHNHWLFVLTGRQTLMTYRGWLWTHGYDYLPVEADVTKMFANPIKQQTLFKKYKIEYVVVGDNEKSVWKANESELSKLYPVIKKTARYTIYKVKPDEQQ